MFNFVRSGAIYRARSACKARPRAINRAATHRETFPILVVKLHQRGSKAMNIWDSVHRSLEKASHEAARIAKIQRLRSTIDSVTRQIHTHEDLLISRTMEIFAAGQLTQSELLAICQELTNLRQQLEQARSDLKAIQSAGSPQTPLPSTGHYAPGNEIAPTVYAPPPPEYQPYSDGTEPVTAPPPPPGIDPLTVSARETIIMNPEGSASAGDTLYCAQCHTALVADNAYCHNCGAPVQNSALSNLPTVRGSAPESLYPAGEATLPEETAATASGAEPETHLDELPPTKADTATPEQSPEEERG
jgi:hypothetical protein